MCVAKGGMMAAWESAKDEPCVDFLEDTIHALGPGEQWGSWQKKAGTNSVLVRLHTLLGLAPGAWPLLVAATPHFFRYASVQVTLWTCNR